MKFLIEVEELPEGGFVARDGFHAITRQDTGYMAPEPFGKEVYSDKPPGLANKLGSRLRALFAPATSDASEGESESGEGEEE